MGRELESGVYFLAIHPNSGDTLYSEIGYQLHIEPDTVAPTNLSVSLSSSDTDPNDTHVLLDLSASDNVAILRYYITEDFSRTPGQDGCCASYSYTISPTQSFTGEVAFNLDHWKNTNNRKLYVWFEDILGNVSSTSVLTVQIQQTDDHGDLPEFATTIPLSSNVSGNLDNYGDYDYFQFEVDVTSRLSIHVEGDCLRGEIFNEFGGRNDSSGNTLGSGDSDGALGLGSEFLPGTYYISIHPRCRNSSDNLKIEYQIQIHPDSQIPNLNSVIQYNNIDIRDGYVGISLNASDDVSLAKYYITENSLKAGVKDICCANSFPISFGKNYSDNVTYQVDPWNTDNARTLYVWVEDAAGNLSSVQEIQVTIHNQITDDHGGLPQLATDLPIDSNSSGVIDSTEDLDYFRFHITNQIDLSIHFQNSWYSQFQIFDSNGDIILSNYVGSEISYERNFIPGIYYILIRYPTYLNSSTYQTDYQIELTSILPVE